MNHEATEIFTKVLLSLTSRSSEIHTFRRLVQIGLPYASDAVAGSNLEWARQLLTEPHYEGWFTDKARFIKEVGGTDDLAAKMTAQQISVLNISVDAASLVFMHSALDASVQDLCLVCSLAAPNDWEPFIAEQKVSLSDVKTADFETLFNQRLSQHVAALERDSLVKRVNRLFQVCRPSGDYSRPGYSYDRDRLEKIDQDRQAVIHGDGVVLSHVDTVLEFLFETGLFLFGMVNHHYGVRVDPQLVRESHGWAKLPKPLQPTSGAPQTNRFE